MNIINVKLLNMKKLSYLFVMIAGMTLATMNVNAQDAKSAPAKKEATAACCKSGEAACAKKCDMKGTASAGANKDANSTSQNKSGVCTKAKAETTVSEAKVSKTVN
jgi:hypothetical protein